MTAAEHRAHHQRLHVALDELVACWLEHTLSLTSPLDPGPHGINRPIRDLLLWSHRMCTEAEALPDDDETDDPVHEG